MWDFLQEIKSKCVWRSWCILENPTKCGISSGPVFTIHTVINMFVKTWSSFLWEKTFYLLNNTLNDVYLSFQNEWMWYLVKSMPKVTTILYQIEGYIHVHVLDFSSNDLPIQCIFQSCYIKTSIFSILSKHCLSDNVQNIRYNIKHIYGIIIVKSACT